jgi:hypothetical protein
MSALAHAIRETQELTGKSVTVIGGLAVVCRVGSPHRATSDLDIVDRRTGGETPQLELLVARSAPIEGRAGALVPTPLGDVYVDVLEVADADFDPLPEDPTARLFVLSHDWAAATATPVIIGAQGQADLEVAVAEPGPLIAMKLQSTFDRGSAKEGTDLLDIVRLTLDRNSGPTAREQLSRADSQLASDVEKHVWFCFDQHADRSLALINAIPEGADTEMDDLQLVRELLIEGLRMS